MTTLSLRNLLAETMNTKKHIKISDYANSSAIPIRHLQIGFQGREIRVC